MIALSTRGACLRTAARASALVALASTVPAFAQTNVTLVVGETISDTIVSYTFGDGPPTTGLQSILYEVANRGGGTVNLLDPTGGGAILIDATANSATGKHVYCEDASCQGQCPITIPPNVTLQVDPSQTVDTHFDIVDNTPGSARWANVFAFRGCSDGATLRGLRIQGASTQALIGAGPGSLASGPTGVRVEACEVVTYFRGISLLRCDDAAITGCEVRIGFLPGLIPDCCAITGGFGIWMRSCNRTNLLGNVFSAGDWYDRKSPRSTDSYRCRIGGQPGNGACYPGAPGGLCPVCDPSECLSAGQDPPIDLISMQQGDHNVIADNLVTQTNAAGIYVSSDQSPIVKGNFNQIVGNLVTLCRQHGIDVVYQDDATILGNSVRDVEQAALAMGACDRATVQWNHFQATDYNVPGCQVRQWLPEGSAAIVLTGTNNGNDFFSNTICAQASPYFGSQPNWVISFWQPGGGCSTGNTIGGAGNENTILIGAQGNIRMREVCVPLNTLGPNFVFTGSEVACPTPPF